MNRGAWRATVHGFTKELDTTKRLTNKHEQKKGVSMGIFSKLTLGKIDLEVFFSAYLTDKKKKFLFLYSGTLDCYQ